jgi:hypothetical protein
MMPSQVQTAKLAIDIEHPFPLNTLFFPFSEFIRDPSSRVLSSPNCSKRVVTSHRSPNIHIYYVDITDIYGLMSILGEGR